MDDREESRLTFEEQRLADRFGTLLREVRQRACQAPHGTVIDCIEGMFLDQGRDLLRQAVETEVQLQADLAEKKGRGAARIAASTADTKAPKNEI